MVVLTLVAHKQKRRISPEQEKKTKNKKRRGERERERKQEKGQARETRTIARPEDQIRSDQTSKTRPDQTRQHQPNNSCLLLLYLFSIYLSTTLPVVLLSKSTARILHPALFQPGRWIGLVD
ncbi:hypothetical protein BO94DRAFT_133962 [Aspergillus sclerotioniger CBS 115572]|uniref:Uncharacterized protein n=1 Tax=Aspergillus sclerotioniger CBS 115572 TaxID=1450535 RepID=A0A317XAU5_9EURO|nr:hypothetical protein BO94DRAFT_133962 [Aspergillus sclerotioniger CBS 115572]PWY95703.1 hypothetical protein BO94DRAFT_133962 [Aspergillus sclerotioniger CBS 115572]